MKLSEAVRYGAEYPDIHGPVFGSDGSCCAIGGVFKALGIVPDEAADVCSNGKFYNAFPLLKASIVCPECKEFPEFYVKSIHGIIAYLFEDHLWSKKAIAMWVETLEPKEVTPNICREEEQEAQESVDMYNDIFGTVKV